MPQIIFFCPPVSVINGGIKHTFRMAETLIKLGYDARIFEQNEQRPSWFSSDAPIVGQGIFKPDADQVYVLPEDQPHILASFKAFPQRKVIYSQNQFYGALGIGNALSYADYGVTSILCSSQSIFEHCRIRHKELKAYTIPCAVDQTLFCSANTKTNTICFMPRKRPIEAVYIRDMFRFSYPHYRDWNWQELTSMNEADVAKNLGQAKVFLSLSKLEGFGLTPLEAMAAGCIVAGFAGLGGLEYANRENGYWAGEDDFPAVIKGLNQAVTLSLAIDNEKNNYVNAAHETLSHYTPQRFTEAVKLAWQEILAS